MNNLVQSLLDPQKPEAASLKDSDGGYCFCLNAAEYFDIEEEDIKRRVMSSLFLTPPFQQVIADKPDLYGPLWIAVTLVAITVASSSLQSYISDTQINFSFVPVAGTLIFSISFLCPYCMAVVVRCLGGHIPIVRLICTYGYSMTAFIPATCVCFINSSFIQTVALGVGYLLSLAFLIKNILSLQQYINNNQRTLCIALFVGSQSILFFTFKFYFFNIK